MKRFLKFFFAVATCLMFCTGLSSAADQAPAVGGTLPEIALDVPEDTELRQYLGLTAKQTFAIPQIKAEVVLIEIFSMY